MSKRKLTQQELEVFKYLNDLRESGITNMFGSPPYVRDRFNLTMAQSRALVSLWMTNFHEDKQAYQSLLI